MNSRAVCQNPFGVGCRQRRLEPRHIVLLSEVREAQDIVSLEELQQIQGVSDE